jgi:hypothetical protein
MAYTSLPSCAYKILVGKPERKRQLERPKCRMLDKIKTNHNEIKC